jgi:hypothetical protein
MPNKPIAIKPIARKEDKVAELMFASLFITGELCPYPQTYYYGDDIRREDHPMHNENSLHDEGVCDLDISNDYWTLCDLDIGDDYWNRVLG